MMGLRPLCCCYVLYVGITSFMSELSVVYVLYVGITSCKQDEFHMPYGENNYSTEDFSVGEQVTDRKTSEPAVYKEKEPPLPQ